MNKNIVTQSSIDYVPHSRDKKYYVILPQLRSAVQPDTFTDVYKLSKRRYPKLTMFTALVWIVVMIGCAWGIYELIFN